MVAIANRRRFSKTTIKNAHKTALRRASKQEINIWLQPEPEAAPDRKPARLRPYELTAHDDVLIPFVVFMWNDGLDYDDDGTPYMDDAPGDVVHSHHLTRKEAEIAAAHLEDAGCNPRDIRIAERLLVPAWSVAHDPRWR